MDRRKAGQDRTHVGPAATREPARQRCRPRRFAGQIAEARDVLTQWLAGADPSALAAELLQAARTEPNVDYLSHAPSLIGHQQSAR